MVSATELDGRERLLQPSLRAAEEERERSRVERKEAQSIRADAEERLRQVMEASAGLLKRERDCEQKWREADLLRAQAAQQQQLLQAQSSGLERASRAAKEERIGLQKVAQELARQMGLLQQAVFSLRDVDEDQMHASRTERDDRYDEEDGAGSIRYNMRSYELGGIATRTKSPMWSASQRKSLIRALDNLGGAAQALLSVAAVLPPPPPPTNVPYAPQYTSATEAQATDADNSLSVVVRSNADMRMADVLSVSQTKEAPRFFGAENLPPDQNWNVYEVQSARDAWVSTIDGTAALRAVSVTPNEDVQLGIRLSLEEAARKVSTLKTSALKYLSDR